MDFRSQPDARPDQRLGAATDEAASRQPPSPNRPQRPVTVRRPLTTATRVVIALALVTVAVAGLTYIQIQRQRRISESTASATPQNAPIGAYTEILALSMDSPTDGWALEHSSDSDSTNAGAWYLLHIAHGVVIRQATLPVLFAYPGHQLPVLQALSPTDVWALVYGPPRYLLHYIGGAWVTATIMTPEGQGRLVVDGFIMRTPTDGWAIGPPETTNSDGFYHYNGATWTPEPAGAAATSSYVTITDMSVAPGGDVWATGDRPDADGAGRLSATGYVFHRASGVWQVTEMPNVELYGITMTGVKSGWIIGAISLPTLPPVDFPLPILTLTFDGVGWTTPSARSPHRERESCYRMSWRLVHLMSGSWARPMSIPPPTTSR